MGGLLSLYAWFQRPDAFGHAAVMSPSLWFGRDRLFDYLRSASLPRNGRFYLDCGTAEGAATLRDVRALRSILQAKRIRARAFAYVEDRDGRHDEAAWGRRIAGALEFLLRG